MRTAARVDPWWAALTVWGVVNAVALLQAAGFASRVLTGDRDVNHALGQVIAALAIPAALALVAFVRSGAEALHRVGPAAFLAFVAFMIAVEYIWPVEFRSPARPAILVPYLVLFFGSILLMGLPMFRMDRRLWLVTVVTTALLLAAMMMAISAGVG